MRLEELRDKFECAECGAERVVAADGPEVCCGQSMSYAGEVRLTMFRDPRMYREVYAAKAAQRARRRRR